MAVRRLDHTELYRLAESAKRLLNVLEADSRYSQSELKAISSSTPKRLRRAGERSAAVLPREIEIR